MHIRTLLAAVPLVLFAASGLRAQDTATEAERATRTKLKSDLRNLVTAQEKYYADHSTYADQMDALAFRPSEGTQVSLVATQNNAWAAVATEVGNPARSCVIYINLAEKYRPGTAQEKRVPTNKEEGAPICDGDPKPES
jgi:hypothetical protein